VETAGSMLLVDKVANAVPREDGRYLKTWILFKVINLVLLPQARLYIVILSQYFIRNLFVRNMNVYML